MGDCRGRRIYGQETRPSSVRGSDAESARMNTLEDAWKWYQEAKLQVGLVRRLASEYWSELPWEGKLGKDDRFRDLERNQLEESARATLGQMDDLAVLVLFSVFESEVRKV